MMRYWQSVLMAAVLCVLSGSVVQAQNLFERLGQAFTQQTPPAVTPPAAAPAPPGVAEPLPAPAGTPEAFTGRPTLGVTVDPLTDEIVRQRRLPVRSGALITAIVQGSPADQAGLPLGGVIVALDGRRIDSPADLVAAIRTAPGDRPVELSYYDGERLYRKRIQLLGATATQMVPAPPAAAGREPQPLRRGPSLGEQLGGNGQRPVLGRVGQLLEGIVAPAAGAVPFAQPAREANETAMLREQVRLLQEELETLRARLTAVESQLEKREAVRD